MEGVHPFGQANVVLKVVCVVAVWTELGAVIDAPVNFNAPRLSSDVHSDALSEARCRLRLECSFVICGRLGTGYADAATAWIVRATLASHTADAGEASAVTKVFSDEMQRQYGLDTCDYSQGCRMASNLVSDQRRS